MLNLTTVVPEVVPSSVEGEHLRQGDADRLLNAHVERHVHVIVKIPTDVTILCYKVYS